MLGYYGYYTYYIHWASKFCWNTRYATLAPNKIFYRAPKIMLLEIDHGIEFTTRRAVTTAEVELVMRVADLPRTAKTRER